LQHPKHSKKNANRYPLPDNSVHRKSSKIDWQKRGDYYCPVCRERWLSEDTIVWALYNYFERAGYKPRLANQRKREGDIKVTNSSDELQWIIEAKGFAPAGYDSIDFQIGLAQILTSRYRGEQQILHALAMPWEDDNLCFKESAARVNDDDRAALRLHWIWVKQTPLSYGTGYTVEIDCPAVATCPCQERIGSFSFWIKGTFSTNS
jgi:hypothetical protein